MVKDLNGHFSKEDIQKDNKSMNKEVLSVTSHQENLNQYNEITPYTCQDSYYQENKRQVLVRCGEFGTLANCWWKCKMVQPV